MNKLGGEPIRCFSAGSHPRGEVHPIALRLLEKSNFPTDGLESKSWDVFAQADAPHMHFVITVCDQAAGEVCPMWPGQPMTAHWGFEDPVAVDGPEDVRVRAFQKVLYQISNRIAIFLSLPMEKLDKIALQQQVREIGSLPPSDDPSTIGQAL